LKLANVNAIGLFLGYSFVSFLYCYLSVKMSNFYCESISIVIYYKLCKYIELLIMHCARNPLQSIFAHFKENPCNITIISKPCAQHKNILNLMRIWKT